MPASARPEPTDLQTGGRRDLTPLTVVADRVPPGRPPQSARHCSPPAAGAAVWQATSMSGRGASDESGVSHAAGRFER